MQAHVFLWEETEMSLFDYPRINIKGTIQLNPGTANNDDYAAGQHSPRGAGVPSPGRHSA